MLSGLRHLPGRARRALAGPSAFVLLFLLSVVPPVSAEAQADRPHRPSDQVQAATRAETPERVTERGQRKESEQGVRERGQTPTTPATPAAAEAPVDSATDRSGEAPAAADDQQPTDIEELRRRIEVLAEELEQLRSGEQEVELTEDRRRALGLAPSAAATYRRRQGVSIAGYGEALYENFEDGGSQLDFLRVVLYTGYRFNEQFVFNSEIELEHANEISVEFAYLDYLVNEGLTLRGGMLLVPLGLINEFHEPNVFLGARRPETESKIIPTTWRENGFGVLGSINRFQYRAYVVNGLSASGFSSEGLRGGRQKGSRAKAIDLAFAGRLDFLPTPGVFVGGGVYAGGSGQGQVDLSGRELDVMTTIGEVHGQAQLRGIDLRVLYTRATLDDVAGLNAVRGLTGGASIGETLQGGYVQIGYNLLSQVTTRVGFTPYYRFETIDTQADVPAGFSIDPARDATLHTIGFELRPIYNIVVKTDYQIIRNDAETGRNQFNINLGYAF